MPAAATDALRQVRIAAAIAHALTDCHIELRARGRRIDVAFGGGELTPCALRHALVLADGSEAALARLLRLPSGPIEVHVQSSGSPSGRHAGLGVYSFKNDLGWGFVFATTLPPGAVAAALDEACAEQVLGDLIDDYPLHVIDDAAIGITVVCAAFSDIPEELGAGDAEALALRAAEACLVAELIADTRPNSEDRRA